MARKTLGTRQKMVFRLPATRPLNPYAELARKRRAGAHEKTRGAQRRAAKIQLVNQARNGEEEAG
jgi:hypothetical protein